MKEKLYPLVSHTSDDSSKLINFCSEFSSTPLVPFAVLGTPMKGYQKSGKVLFTILVPFTTSDNGNGHNCVPYVPNLPLSGNEPLAHQKTQNQTEYLRTCGNMVSNTAGVPDRMMAPPRCTPSEPTETDEPDPENR